MHEIKVLLYPDYWCKSTKGRGKVILIYKAYITTVIRNVCLFFYLFQPEAVYQSTKVVQHHSCTTVAPIWSYPLSLAHRLWTNCLSKSEDGSADTDKETSQPHRRTDMSHMSVVERRSHLPQALPLTCPSPHWHRLVRNKKDMLSAVCIQ